MLLGEVKFHSVSNRFIMLNVSFKEQFPQWFSEASIKSILSMVSWQQVNQTLDSRKIKVFKQLFKVTVCMFCLGIFSQNLLCLFKDVIFFISTVHINTIYVQELIMTWKFEHESVNLLNVRHFESPMIVTLDCKTNFNLDRPVNVYY